MAQTQYTTTPNFGEWVFSAGERTCADCGRTIPTRETHFALYPRFHVHYCRECMQRERPARQSQEQIREVVHLAVTRQLPVDLGYHGTTRTIRPYGFSLTCEGNTLLHAIRVDCQETRTYRMDRIEGATFAAGSLPTTRAEVA